MKTVLDFNGYFDSQSQFHIKEYSLCPLDDDGNLLSLKHEIFSPSDPDFKKLDLLTRQNYMKYHQKYGIEWTSRTYTPGRIQPNVPYFLFTSNLIFVANQNKEKLLRTYLKQYSGENRLLYDFIRLQDIGYNSEANERQRTPCIHHINSLNNNCAKDNVLDMVRFVKANRVFNNYILKRIHVAIDFNSWTTDYYGIKELSIIKMGHNGIMADKSLEVATGTTRTTQDANIYRTYFHKHGIRWRSGRKDFKHLRCQLSRTLDQALFVYVKNNNQKEILCQVSRNARNKIVRLDEFGYNAENFELSKTKCAWHLNPNVNNCAEDNARFMANWLISNGLYNKSRRDSLMQLQIQSKIDSCLASTKLACRAQYSKSTNEKFESPVNVASNSSSKVDNRKPSSKLARYYEAFGSIISEDVSSKHQRIDSTSVDSHEDDGDIDPDFTEYLGKNDIRLLTFDPEVFNRVTDKLMVEKEEVDDKDSDDFSLERLLTDGESNSDVHNFDADLFDELIFKSVP